jgi:hypothetical protein
LRFFKRERVHVGCNLGHVDGCTPVTGDNDAKVHRGWSCHVGTEASLTSKKWVTYQEVAKMLLDYRDVVGLGFSDLGLEDGGAALIEQSHLVQLLGLVDVGSRVTLLGEKLVEDWQELVVVGMLISTPCEKGISGRFRSSQQ